MWWKKKKVVNKVVAVFQSPGMVSQQSQRRWELAEPVLAASNRSLHWIEPCNTTNGLKHITKARNSTNELLFKKYIYRNIKWNDVSKPLHGAV